MRSIHQGEYADQQGFTLLEILVSLIIGAILGALLVQFMGTSMVKSTQPIIRIQQHLTLNRIMENITADYKKLLAEDSTSLATLKTYIDNGNVDANIPYYGAYTPATAYILFSGGNEIADTGGSNRFLKVRLTNGEQSIVTVFSQ